MNQNSYFDPVIKNPPKEPPYNLSHNAEFLQPFANALHHGTESISYFDRPKDLGYVFRFL